MSPMEVCLYFIPLTFMFITLDPPHLGPLVKIKKAIADLNRDIVRTDVRIAVLEHTLMQSKVREKEEANDDKADFLLNEPEFD